MNRMVSAPVTLIACVYAGGSNTPLAASLSILPAMPGLLFQRLPFAATLHSAPAAGTTVNQLHVALASFTVQVSGRLLSPRTRRRHGWVSRCHHAISMVAR